MSLNLDNFETDLASDTPYILTSPRSLKTCSLLDVQPIDLVYKNLEEYEESLCDLPLSEIYRIYEENETKRQELLLKCREQRQSLKHKSKMAVSQVVLEETSDSSDSSGGQNNNDRSRKSTRSAAHQPKEENVTPRLVRRFTSAPSVNKSQNLKQSANFKRNNLKSSLASLSPRSRSSSGRRLVFQNSDTESTEEKIHTILIEDPYYSSRSVPDLTTKSNLDFRKLASSPRNHCPCNWEAQDKNILSEYLRQYGDILECPDLSFEDRKIMECLILKKGRKVEWERKSQEARKLFENDRIQRWTENQSMMQNWQEKLAEKRRFENLENTKRYLQLQDKWQSSRSNLMQYLEERDKKVQQYLEDRNYKKKKSLIEKQKREAVRQLEVGKAIEKLVEEDRQHRQILKDKLQRRMQEADTRKRRRERDYYRHVTEMNRMEDIKRSLKLERIEQRTRESVEELKNQIEEKEHRARINYLNRIRLRDRSIEEGSGSRQQAIQKVQAIHSDLLKGLEDWHKKVLEIHTEAQKRAEIKYNQEIHRRRIRVASDRILREERSSEMLRKVHEVEEQRMDLLKAVIESKDTKSTRVRQDKERKVQISRIRAQHACELRQQLKDKLDPETFDRKVARIEMEMRILKRTPPQGFSVKFNPKLINKRCSSSYGCKSRSHSRFCVGGSAKAHGGGLIKCFHN